MPPDVGTCVTTSAQHETSAAEQKKKTLRLQDRELREMSDEGTCLSMHQPWASLLVRGIKQYVALIGAFIYSFKPCFTLIFKILTNFVTVLRVVNDIHLFIYLLKCSYRTVCDVLSGFILQRCHFFSV